MDEIKQLKSVLRSLVVSSPVQMTLANLLRDYRNMMGCPIPIIKYGYRDPLQFLKDRCGDCFLFQGYGTNTILVPIVPECLKHIDEFVHKQKVSSKIKFKGKRRSINESALRPAPDLIAKTFETNCQIKTEPPRTVRERQSVTPRRNIPLPPERDIRQPEKIAPSTPNIEHTPLKPVDNNLNKYKSVSHLSDQNKENRHQDQSLPSKEAYKNFIRNRLPVYESVQDLSNDSKSYKDSESGSYTSGSGQRTLSSSSSTKAIQLDELKGELLQLIKDSPNGVCTTDLMKLYRERYGRELNFSRFGFSSVAVLACGLPGVLSARDAGGATRVTVAPPASPASPASPAPLAPPAPPAGALRRQPVRRATCVASDRADDDDALPWIDFDPDVFPEDCMSFSESIPSISLSAVQPGSMLEVMVGEVYSPSHFWLYLLGDQYNIAMEDMMDEMTNYYTSGEGSQRSLAAGAVRVGHYCSSVYERDWHRSLIVKIVDSETVKVRHVDYGTVDAVAARRLRPLPRRWAELPAQAVRARLAGARPAARGRRWPHAAAAAFLRLVQDRRLVGNVAHVDREENIVELFLVDTSTERDVRIDLELIRAGHADPRVPADDHACASYLYPRFDALESGDTPNFADIHAYLRDGIALEYVEDYSRHVPPALPPEHASHLPPAQSKPLPPPRALDNRVPLIPRAFVDTAVVAPISYDPDSSERESSVDEEPESPHEPAVESEAPPADQTCEDVSQQEEAEAPSPVPVAPETRVVSAPQLAEVSPEKTKPACRAAPRVVPDFRFLPLSSETRSHSFLGQPPMPAPFFVFPQPGPPLPPYPSYPVQPVFPPRPYTPAMDGYFPPQQNYQPQMRPRYPGPVYSPAPPPFSSGSMYSSSYSYPPAVSHPNSRVATAPVLNPPVFSAPVIVSSTPTSKRPIVGTPGSNLPITSTPLPRPPVSTLPARPTPTPVVTASVAPTPILAGVDTRQPSSHSPPPPYNGGPRRITTGHGEVTLTVSECEIFNLLSSVDPNAAHWYIVDAISRAMSTRTTDATNAPVVSTARAENGSRLNPEASEFRATTALRPPPGFGGN